MKEQLEGDRETAAFPLYRAWLCGPFRLERRVGSDYRPLDAKEWGGHSSPRTLLKALACAPRRRASRGTLLAQLWPDASEEQANRALHMAVYGLRKVLSPVAGQDCLRTEEDGLGFSLPAQASLWVDADAALTLVEKVERVGQHSPEAVPLLEEALTYFQRGAFLENDEGEWAANRRAVMERRCYCCRLWLADMYAQQCRLAEAETLLNELLADDPTDEDVVRRLMQLLHQRGLTHQALVLYKRTGNVFAQEGLEISEATRMLAAQLPGAGKNVQVGKTALIFPASKAATTKITERVVLDCATLFGVQLSQAITLIHQWQGMAMFCNELQDQLDSEIKKLDTLKTDYPREEYTLSRRSFLATLAALPAAIQDATQQRHKFALVAEEFLPYCAASITACWHLSSGRQLEAILPMIQSYFPFLCTLCQHTPAYRTVAADLLAQIYFLRAILAWHVEGLDAAEAYCTQAMQYVDLTENVNVRLTALNQYALISYYRRNFQKALVKSKEAEALLRQTSRKPILPIVQGRVYMYLAAIQAQQKEKEAESTLEQAHLAFASQTSTMGPVPIYADCGNAPLTLWDGLTRYYLGHQGSTNARRAWDSLRTFGQLQSSIAIPERFRLECLNNRILAAIQLNELEDALACFEAGLQGANDLASKQRYTELEYASQLMIKQWPTEKRVKKRIRPARG